MAGRGRGEVEAYRPECPPVIRTTNPDRSERAAESNDADFAIFIYICCQLTRYEVLGQAIVMPGERSIYICSVGLGKTFRMPDPKILEASKVGSDVEPELFGTSASLYGADICMKTVVGGVRRRVLNARI